MMDVGIIAVDADKVNEHLGELGESFGLTVQQLAHDQMYLFVKDLMRMTEPGSMGEGRGAINRDLGKIFNVANDRSKRVYVMDPKAFHRASRAPHTGRVYRHLGKHRMWITRRDFLALRKALYAVVGTLKAGWVPALTHWGRKAAAAPRIPAWVARLTKRYGSAGGSINAHGQGNISSTNAVVYAGRKIPAGIVRAAQRRRQRDLHSFATQRIERLAQRFSRNKTGAVTA